MVKYIRSDLEFILKQIKIAEDHALWLSSNGTAGKPLYGTPNASIPAYNISWGLRTVDGSYNHLLPGQEKWGASDQPFKELMKPVYRTIMVDPDGPGASPAVPMLYKPGVDNDGPTMTLPGGQVIGNRAGPGDVIDPSLRTISNLIVDQTLANPIAIMVGLERAGVATDVVGTATAINAAFKAIAPFFAAVNAAQVAQASAEAAANANPSPANQAALDAANAALAEAQADLVEARGPLDTLLETNGIEMDGANILISNAAPDEGLSAPFNSWFTLFGQFFDHGLDLVNKGGSGTVMIPLQPDDPLYVPGSPTNFMVLTRATTAPGADGVYGTADDVRPINTTTPYVDQNQTYTSHPSHQVFLRQYVMTADGPAATGKLIEGANGGMANWGEVKAQAKAMLGITLTDLDVGTVPLLRTDPYGNFIPSAAGYPQVITGVGADGIPNTNDDTVISGTPANPVSLTNAIRTNMAFLADIAHFAVPDGLADGDTEVGGNIPEDGFYDNELLDAHFIAGDGRANENIGLTAVHHVFHSEHNRLVQHTKDTVLESGDLAFINEWLATDITSLPTTPAAVAALVWDGERLFQAAKFGTEMQYQHLVFEEFARKIQPNINVFLVPDGFDTMMDPSIFAEFAHVVYRFGHSMLNEQIDMFDPQFNEKNMTLIQGFLNPAAFNGPNGEADHDLAAGAIIRGMTRQVGNEIDEFVTGALRNNLLGLPLDLATINLARGRDTGVPSLNEARRTFFEMTNQDALLTPYSSWVDFAGNLKHEASIINFIAAYGTHQTITSATTVEAKRDAAMALVGLTQTGSEAIVLSNASFEADSLASGAPNVNTDPLGNYTFTAPTGWTLSGTGGLFDPAATITNNASIDGTNVAWLGQGGVLSRTTSVIMEAGVSYSLSFDMGDRTDTVFPGGVARLLAADGTVLAETVLTAPADGQWSTVTFQTGAITAAQAGQALRIEIAQTGGTTNQILIDDVKLNALRPLAPLNEEDRQAFLNGTGQYAANKGGLENVDLWIGGLAEKIMPFGGMLGSTFNFVFEAQMELLQSGDRFYYLQRLDGLHLFGEMENNSFAAMMMRNTDATHLPSDVFSTPGLILEIDRTKQYNAGLGEDAGADGILVDNPNTTVNESADNRGNDPTGGSILTPLVIRNDPSTAGLDTNYLRYTGGDHVVLGGTAANDTLVASIGDDTLYGDEGADKMEGGFGNDIINGGDGDDIIKDMGGDDNIKGGAGNDVVHAGPGLDLVMGNDGQDFIFLGTDMGSEVFAGQGDDFIYGNRNAERILGNEGNDWIETGTFDGAPGDNFDEVFAHDEIDGHDVFLGDGGFDEFIGEGGDDIMVGSTGRGKMAGMSGFDWATYKDSTFGVNADLSRPIIFDEAPTLPGNAALDEYASMEGLSGSKYNDILGGSNSTAEERLPVPQGGSEGYRGSRVTKESLQLIAGLAEVLGLTTAQVNALAAGQAVFSGDIILGGDGSDRIQGNAGDDVIDGNKWLNVRIEVTGDRPTGVAQFHTSMTTLAAHMFSGAINPGQLRIVREITSEGDTVADTDTAVFTGARSEYAFSATADGQVVITHSVEGGDGTDKLRNIERVEFSDNAPLNIIVGTVGNDTLDGTPQDDLILGLAGADTLNGGAGNDILVGGADGTTSTSTTATYADSFNTSSSANQNGTANFASNWTESGDFGGTGTGQIRIDDGTDALRFYGGTNAGDYNGAQITRTMNLSTATSVTITYSANPDNLDPGETVTVQFAANGTTFVDLQVISGDGGSTNYSHTLTGPFAANAAIRFVTTAMNATNEGVSVDNLVITRTTVTTATAGDTLNGGLGDDTYSFTLGDGNDVINEGVSATSGGAADRISILAPTTNDPLTGLPVIDPATDLPVRTLAALNAFDTNDNSSNGSLVINYAMVGGTQQSITVNGQYTGANAQTGVERINFNGATYAGYALGADDYLISRDDGDANLAASTANNMIVGEDTDNDTITGGIGNDLIFGGGVGDDLVGGDGDDLIVGGAGNDSLDARQNAANDDLAGALGADTMVGGAGNDTYGVDDLLDVIVEDATADVDTVETFMAALSLQGYANVENLSYEGADADQFVGTGNALNNVISGGDLNDTLSGLAGNDTLNGGLGADTMIGGEGNDTYVVDDAGDVVNESTGLAADVDTVQSAISFTLAAGLENLTLANNDADINGTGNASNNTIVGNDGANQLFGGAGADNIDAGDGIDLVDGGSGDDTLSGGAGGDTDTIIGGDGNDTIDVGSGNDIVRYASAAFGNDTINNFDSTGGSIASQDLIDLSALGITAANFGARVTIADVEDGTVDDTLITVRDAGGATIGTITLQEVEATGANGVTSADFILAAGAPTTPVAGATNGPNTINGTAGDNLINGQGGNDTLNGLGGADFINGDEGADTLNGGDGNDTLSGGAGIANGAYADNFGTAAYNNNNGSLAFAGNWDESGDNDQAATGDILVTAGVLRFAATVDGNDSVQRAINLTGATAPTLSFTYTGAATGETIVVEALNGNTWQQVGANIGGTTSGTFSAALSAAHSAIRFRTTSGFDAGETFSIDNVSAGLGPNSGVDTINGDAGDDMIIWNANTAAPTDGRDLVDGGTEGTSGDTFVINGRGSEAETYNVYARTGGQNAALAASLGTTFAANTEIVITRTVGATTTVVAELSEIEEIRINGVDPSGTTGTVSGDTFNIIGDFSGTSLRLNTITITGSSADDVVDITELTSAHRVVFDTKGGADTIKGDKRAQDVINVTDDGTLVDARIAAGGSDDDEDENDHDDDHGHDDDQDEDEDAVLTGGSGDDKLSGGSEKDVLNGGSGDDTLDGRSDDDLLNGGSGDDVLKGGSGDDRLNGGSGDDQLNGGSGKDVLDGGSGDDTLTGGSGADIFRFGNRDTILDFEGDDKLDLSSEGVTSANFTQKVTLSQSGADTWLSVGSSKMLLSNVDADDLYLENFILAQITGNDVDETPTMIDETPTALEPSDAAALLAGLEGETFQRSNHKECVPVNDYFLSN